jgi:peptidyl-prolyl cis-trans isomerase D
MLEFMRRFASSLVGKILGGILLIGLAGFGIQNVILTLGGDTVAKVGDQEISTQEFQRAYQQQIQAFAQRTGQSPTNQQALQMGIPSAVIFQLAGNAAVVQLANRYGIGVSDEQLAKQVREDPSYFGILGTFDRAIFDQTLQQNGLTEAQFFGLQAKASQREQLGTALFSTAPVPQTAASLLNNYQNGTRTVEYFTLNQTSIPDVGTPTDADLEAYLKAHQDTYKTKETRTADVIYLNPDVLAPLYQPTEDEIKAEYDKTKDQLSTAEKRHIEQVVLNTPELQKAFTDAKAAGTPFADVVAATKAAPTDFGVLAKADVTDPALADAAFGLAKAGDFTIIPGVAGKRAVAVTEIQGGGRVSYDQAKADIAQRLASQKAREGYPELQDQIESLRAALKPLKDIADRYKLPIETVTLTADGSALSAVPGLAQEDRSKISQAVFAATQGKLAPTINFGSTSNAWFDLSKVDPARDQTLAEVRDAVATAWTNDKTDAALQAEVKSIMAELDGGKSFADVAAEKNQFSTVSPPITRQGDKSNVLTTQVADKIFSTGPDGHGWAVDGDGEYLVYHVTDATPPTGKPADNIVSFVDNSLRTSLTSEFITGVRDDYGVHINQQALAQVLNLDQPAQ